MRRVRRCAAECQVCIYQRVHSLCTSEEGEAGFALRLFEEMCVSAHTSPRTASE